MLVYDQLYSQTNYQADEQLAYSIDFKTSYEKILKVLRDKNKRGVRWPISNLTIYSSDSRAVKNSQMLANYLKQNNNIDSLKIESVENKIAFKSLYKI